MNCALNSTVIVLLVLACMYNNYGLTFDNFQRDDKDRTKIVRIHYMFIKKKII